MKVSVWMRAGDNCEFDDGSRVAASGAMSLQINEYARTLLAAGLWSVNGDSAAVLKGRPSLLDARTTRDQVVMRAMREKLVPALAAFFADQDWPVDEELRALDEFFRRWEATLYASLDPVLQRLEELGVRAMIIKGGDLALSAYSRRPALARIMSDIDLLVKPPDVPNVQKALVAHGFEQGVMDRRYLAFRKPDSPDCAPVDISPYYPVDHYELPVFGKFVAVPEMRPFGEPVEDVLRLRNYHLAVVDDQAYIPVKCDVHINVARGIDLDDVWRHPREFTLPSGRIAIGQSASGMVWFLASRLYHEVCQAGSGTIRQFIDVLAVVNRWQTEIDWDEVMAMATKYELRAGLYYVLTHANEFLGSVVPAMVLEGCYPAQAGIRRDHDWGDLMPKLLGGVAITPVL